MLVSIENILGITMRRGSKKLWDGGIGDIKLSAAVHSNYYAILFNFWVSYQSFHDLGGFFIDHYSENNAVDR